MAFWNRKRSYVYVYTYRDGRQVALPRSQVTHLDSEPDHNINAWVQQYELQYEKRSITPDHLLLESSPLAKLVRSYENFLSSRGKSANTVSWHVRLLRDHAIPFFLEGKQPLSEPATWPSKSIKLLEWLQGRDMSPDNIVRTNIALKGFYNFISDEGFIAPGVSLRLRRPVIRKKNTPLKVSLTPSDVLRFAKKCGDSEVKLMLLVGYFCSLRPQETFGLAPSDFRAGSPVLELECSRAMKKAGLYDRLVVNISKQLSPEGHLKGPKSQSKGWVACFDEKAARMIVAELMHRVPSKRLFTTHSRTLFKTWSAKGYPGVTLKDLRRSSLLWLGHHSALQLTQLVKHARHSRIETTMLYLRRPEEHLEQQEISFDLDA